MMPMALRSRPTTCRSPSRLGQLQCLAVVPEGERRLGKVLAGRPARVPRAPPARATDRPRGRAASAPCSMPRARLRARPAARGAVATSLQSSASVAGSRSWANSSAASDSGGSASSDAAQSLEHFAEEPQRLGQPGDELRLAGELDRFAVERQTLLDLPELEIDVRGRGEVIGELDREPLLRGQVARLRRDTRAPWRRRPARGARWPGCGGCTRA